ncbi:MAG: hypothetical protein RO257_05855 [Candidatus Kapabacteria bacterium]|nr:hypothetical protein [Candidatus Kapabacteria bacterium]
MKKIIIIILAVIVNGCYTDTINKLETFSIQLPIFFDGPFVDRSAPDTSIDFSNLYQYPEYEQNRSRISKAEILQLNYRIDSLVFGDGTVYDPKSDSLEFEFIRYSFHFAKPIAGNEYSTNPADFIPDPDQPKIILGEFKDVKISDYYREAKQIIVVPESSAKIISEGLKTRPYFFAYTEYSKVKGQTTDEFVFKLIKAKFDVFLRLEVKL